MKFTAFNKKMLSFIVLVTLIWIGGSYLLIQNQQTNLKQQKYQQIYNRITQELNNLHQDKKEAMRLLALTLAHDSNVKKALTKNNPKLLNLSKFSLTLMNHTNFKSIWIQVIDRNGKSLLRSWSDKRGDDLSIIRKDVKEVLLHPQIRDTLSVGKFDLTFKSIVPLFDDKKKFIGLIECIGKYNSITKKMREKGFRSVVMLDEKHSKKLKFPFTKRFLQNRYIANLDADEELLSFIETMGVDYFKGEDRFFINKDASFLIAVRTISNLHTITMGKIIIFKDLNSINMLDIKRTKKQTILLHTISYFVFMGLIYYIFIKRYQHLISKLNIELNQKVASQTEKLEEQNRTHYYMAHHDYLTGLPNRLECIEQIETKLDTSKKACKEFSLLFLDLDRFKEVNDTYGHDLGDKLLKVVSEKLKSNIRSNNLVARLGGDEFIIILDQHTKEQVITYLKRILKTMAQPIILEQHTLYTSFSIGVSSFPRDGDNVELLIRNADTAMYSAKALGRNQYSFYDPSMTESTMKKMHIENMLRHAISENRFQAYYQLQIDGLNNSIVGAEGLIRWFDEDEGFISPEYFIPIAEELNLISKIDEWMLQETCRQMIRWQKLGLHTGKISLNLSIKQLEDENFLPFIENFIKDSSFDTELLEFEITENQIMKDPELSIKKLKSLQAMGISIAIDDFGTGHSSLSYLKRLPIDKLKIDRSFITDLPSSKDDIAIVKSIIVLAKSLNLEVIAEGVETLAQKNFLLREGCTLIQGYYYAKPLPASEYEKSLSPMIT